MQHIIILSTVVIMFHLLYHPVFFEYLLKSNHEHQNENNLPCRLNKEFSSKFSEGYLLWLLSEEGWMIKQPKCCDYNNNLDEDTSLNTSKNSKICLNNWTHSLYSCYYKILADPFCNLLLSYTKRWVSFFSSIAIKRVTIISTSSIQSSNVR